MTQEEWRRHQQLLRLAFDHERKVKKIARHDPIATVVHLLGNDFGGSLHLHI